jgi:hypothetical protein
MENYIKLRKSIDTFNQHWRDGTLKKLKTELPKFVDNGQSYSISDVKEKDDEIHIRFFNGLYTRWKKVVPTDEIVFNDKNYKLMWAN